MFYTLKTSSLYPLRLPHNLFQFASWQARRLPKVNATEVLRPKGFLILIDRSWNSLVEHPNSKEMSLTDRQILQWKLVVLPAFFVLSISSRCKAMPRCFSNYAYKSVFHCIRTAKSLCPRCKVELKYFTCFVQILFMTVWRKSSPLFKFIFYTAMTLRAASCYVEMFSLSLQITVHIVIRASGGKRDSGVRLITPHILTGNFWETTENTP